MSYALAFAFGYLLGSIPFGLLLTRAAGAPDIRTIGSGNIGATNVLRTGRKWLAATTLFCDMFKGTVAVLVAKHFGMDAALAAGLGAFFGHLFPIWLTFKGGKGVATYIGVLGLWAFDRPHAATLFLFLTAALWFMHRENIARLLNGTEGKIGVKAAATSED